MRTQPSLWFLAAAACLLVADGVLLLMHQINLVDQGLPPSLPNQAAALTSFVVAAYFGLAILRLLRAEDEEGEDEVSFRGLFRGL